MLDVFWYHKINLGDEVTPGNHPHKPEFYGLPERLDGKRVLDVGAWDGYWTFEALRRGAKYVLAIDNFSDLPCLEKKERKEWDTFDYCKKILGYGYDECKRKTMDIYDVNTLPPFDVVLFFGTLYHCRYPLLALDKLSEICKDEIYVETAVCNDYSPYKQIGAGYANERDVVMEFYPGSEYGGIPTNWWAPTTTCLQFMMQSAGWENVETWKMEHPNHVCFCRGFAKGKKKHD